MTVRRIVAIFFAGSLLAGAFACQRFPGQPLEADRHVASDQVSDFDLLFNQNCVGCHGASGRSGAAPPLDNPLYLALTDAKTIGSIVSNGIPGTSMPAFSPRVGGPLTDRQIELLADEIVKRWSDPSQFRDMTLPPLGSPGPPASPGEQTEPTEPAGDADRGASAFATFCAHCHGQDGTGGPNGKSVVDPAYLGLTSDYGLRATIVVGRSDEGMPDWRGYVPNREMSTQEISDVVAWLRSHKH